MTSRDLDPISARSNPRNSGQLILINKPKGWTSFDIVAVVRKVTRTRRVGHAGTLDPMATGLLVVCTGPRTKEMTAMSAYDKEYRATVRLGASTASYDAETPITEERGIEGLTEERVTRELADMVGKIQQVPPMYSAVKIGGRRLYELARRGQTVERTPREVEIHSITDIAVLLPDVSFTVECSKGTYIRSLAHDLGERCGCGGYLTDLVRTRVGPYRLADAMTVDDLRASSLYDGVRSA